MGRNTGGFSDLEEHLEELFFQPPERPQSPERALVAEGLVTGRRPQRKLADFLERHGLGYVHLSLESGEEITREARRLGVSRSAVLAAAWRIARAEIARLEGVPLVGDETRTRGMQHGQRRSRR